MTTQDFQLVCQKAGVPDYHVDAYLRGCYTPGEWSTIWSRYVK